MPTGAQGAQHHIVRAREYFSDSGNTDSSGTNTAKAQAQAAIAIAISLDRIATALEERSKPESPLAGVMNTAIIEKPAPKTRTKEKDSEAEASGAS